ncbi:MAG: hypothetical protein ACYDAI_15380 [Trichloromonadaceae bacterium]
MIEAIVGSINYERVLTFLIARGEGYAREILQQFSGTYPEAAGQTVRDRGSGM